MLIKVQTNTHKNRQEVAALLKAENLKQSHVRVAVMHRARVAMACVIALLAALMPLLVVGQVRYFDPVIDVPSIRFPLDDCVPYYPPPSEGGGIGYNCSYSTMGRVAVIGRAGHLSGTQLTTVSVKKQDAKSLPIAV
jgi:hypothetical protein